MKYLFAFLPEIKKQLEAKSGPLLMLDFDGTLAPLASTPAEAFLPAATKRELRACSELFPVAIVSGRSLVDIKNKVKLKKLIYAGNHGLEWQIGKRINRVPAAVKAVKEIKNTRTNLVKLRQLFPGVLLEYKRLSLSIHYRRLAPSRIKNFKKLVVEVLKHFRQKHDLKITTGKKIIELRPNINWHKGEFSSFLHKKLGKKLLPIYIGDDETDEDAFKSLPQGITIRVGQSRSSRARYYLKTPAQTTEFLRWLSGYVKNSK